MAEHAFAKPYYIFFIMMPGGISLGFATVTLPYILTHNGFTVAGTAAIVALGVSASLWRFLWGPIADLTLSLRKWYCLGVLASAATLLLLCLTPFTVQGALWLTLIVFISQVAANLVLLLAGGFMANRIEQQKKGRASGFYQAGLLGGIGLGGGAGLWLATHYNAATAGVILGTVSILFASLVWKIKDVEHPRDKSLKQAIISVGKDVLALVRIPVVLFIVIMICLPIGSGAASNLWSAVAADWNTDADTVALVTGILSGLVSAVGSLVGGYMADRWGIWKAYLGSGIICAFVALVMALFPYQPRVYVIGVLAYSFGLGLINAAFSSSILFAIGKANAVTKYSLLSSLGNLPVVYMTTFDGWAHDRYNSKYMLMAEALIGVLFIMICAVALYQMKTKHLLSRPLE
jgi:MFS transporter, PAT family, beta-lactamase induction signal transducer AmpG